jgi:diamine N-acetyltransferase
MLTGEKILLRALEPQDLDLLFKWENDPENWFVSNTQFPFSRNALKKFIQNSDLDLYKTGQLRLVIVERSEGKAIGCVDLFDYDHFNLRAGIGILIHDREKRNHGFASEALKIMLDYCFEYLGIHLLYCNIAHGNENSIKLFKNTGFELAGTKRSWLRTESGYIDEHMFLITSDQVISE